MIGGGNVMVIVEVVVVGSVHILVVVIVWGCSWCCCFVGVVNMPVAVDVEVYRRWCWWLCHC